jgi:hypothetical protein
MIKIMYKMIMNWEQILDNGSKETNKEQSQSYSLREKGISLAVPLIDWENNDIWLRLSYLGADQILKEKKILMTLRPDWEIQWDFVSKRGGESVCGRKREEGERERERGRWRGRGALSSPSF